MSPEKRREPLNWLGFPDPFSQPVSRVALPSDRCPAALGALLHPRGDAVAREATDVQLWYDDDALHLRARCHTAAMDRVRALAARPTPYARDAWGDDALEVQIDAGRTRRRHFHFILPPNGLPITFLGANNRQEQGWHPLFAYRVTLEEDAWVVEADFPFAILGGAPRAGDTWGFNVMRVNPGEDGGYVQWAPTFGDALRPELLGEMQFGSEAAGGREAETAAFARRADERQRYFLAAINGVTAADTLRELGMADWAAWGDYLARRAAPVPLRWEDITPGREGILEQEAPWLLASADACVEEIARWSADPPEPAALAIERLEALGDAYLLTGERRYVDAFERAIQLHARRVEEIAAGLTGPDQLPYYQNPYHDSQIIRVEMLAYAYLTLRAAGLAPETHAAMMRTVLRGCRFAAYEISTAYTYGNHQIYESAGLASVAALFPEFPECADWARIASRAIRLHFEHEVYPDGGYLERCGYHCVSMSYVMHAVATVRANGIEARFPELMAPDTLRTLERMHEWLLAMTAPDGTLPAFGDCGASPMLRFFRRGAAFFGRPDFVWPLGQLAQALVPPGLTPREPSMPPSASLESQFTVMRDDWTPDAMYMAVDHGPLTGQHGHLDTQGFVAYAHGRPVALDSGIGITYEDPRYLDWFRHLRAHNVIVIDDIEAEKVAERRFWKSGPHADVLGTRSRAYEHALGVLHDRTFFFVKGVGWLIHDRLHAPAGLDLSRHRIEWMLHTPYALAPEASGVLHAADDDGGLLVLAAFPESLQAPRLELMPASVPIPAVRAMRLWDIGCHGPRATAQDRTPAVTTLAWPWQPTGDAACEFATFLLPYQGIRPDARLRATDQGVILQRAGEPEIIFHTTGDVVFPAEAR